MTNDKEKEELKKEFHKWYFDSEGEPDKELLDAHIKWLDEVFDFFYSEIEARGKEIYKIKVWADKQLLENEEMQNKMKSQSEIIQAADEVMKSLDIDHRPNWVHNTDETYEALEKYNSLKGKI